MEGTKIFKYVYYMTESTRECQKANKIGTEISILGVSSRFFEPSLDLSRPAKNLSQLNTTLGLMYNILLIKGQKILHDSEWVHNSYIYHVMCEEFWHILKLKNSQVAKLNSRENLLLSGTQKCMIIITCVLWLLWAIKHLILIDSPFCSSSTHDNTSFCDVILLWLDRHIYGFAPLQTMAMSL